jgi:hypothetical protein
VSSDGLISDKTSYIGNSSEYSEAHPGFDTKRKTVKETKSETSVFKGHHFGSLKKGGSIKSDNLISRQLTSGEIESERIKRIIDQDTEDEILSTRALNGKTDPM